MKFIPTESGWYWGAMNHNPCVVTVMFRQRHMYEHDWQEAIVHLGSLSLVHIGFLDKETGKLINHTGNPVVKPKGRVDGWDFEFISKIDDADVPMTVGVIMEETK